MLHFAPPQLTGEERCCSIMPSRWALKATVSKAAQIRLFQPLPEPDNRSVTLKKAQSVTTVIQTYPRVPDDIYPKQSARHQLLLLLSRWLLS